VQGKHREDVTTARQAIAFGQRGGEMKHEVMGSLAVGMAIAYLDRLAKAQLRFEQAVQFATSEEVVDAEITACKYLVGMIFEEGDYSGSRAVQRRQLERMVR